MDHAVLLTRKQQRIDRDKQGRSDALNRALMARDQAIAELKAQLLATRLCAGLGFVITALAVLKALLATG